MEKHLCLYEKVIDQINMRLNRIEGKLDSALSFKWKLTGSIITISLIISAGVTLLAAYLNK
jgi:hypothetical protein